MRDDERQNDIGGPDEATLAELMRLAGPRADVPADVEARVYERALRAWQTGTAAPDGTRVYKAVHRQWQRSSPQPRRWLLPFVLAATVLLAVAVGWRTPDTTAPAPVVATIARVVPGAGATALPAPGDEVVVGQQLLTSAGQGLSLSLGHGESLRVDENTRLRVEGGGKFRLLAGRVYADTGDVLFQDRGLVIETGMGIVTDVGTQFSVALGEETIDIAVREGRVDLSQGASVRAAIAGERLRVHRRDGATVDTLAPHAAYWNWTTSLAPAFDIENRSLLDFLRWAARETGYELVFADNELRMAAMRTNLHGSIDDLAPLDAVKSVLATTRFRHRVETGRLVIER